MRKYNDQVSIFVISAMSLFIVYGVVRHFKNKKEARKKYKKLLLKIEDAGRVKPDKVMNPISQ